MARPKKKTDPSGLIAIANPSLARKLDSDAELLASDKNKQNTSGKKKQTVTFEQDRWRAVLTLNILRYILALFLVAVSALPNISQDFHEKSHLIHPTLFMVSAIVLLVSAVCFTILTSKRIFELSHILVGQLGLDIILAGVFMHATGSISSNFILLFFVVVTTGSVVLSRTQAIALASAATIIILYEHLYSSLKENAEIASRFDTLALYCVTLMIIAWCISYIARRLRQAELSSFVPGNESIDEYLVREEKSALAAALSETNGNKTEAAKLLGMTFRSFRYKLTKYDIH